VNHAVVRIVLIALLLRLGAVVAVHLYLERAGRDFLIPGDANGYRELGRKIAGGQEYSLYEPPRRAMRMPGFPLFLAATFRIGGDQLILARLLLAATGAITCGLVWWLGHLLFDARTAWVAGLLAAVSPTLIGFSPLILSEILFGACLTASLLLLARLTVTRDRGGDGPGNDTAACGPESSSCSDRSITRTASVRIRLALMAGASIAVATCVRPTWLIVAPLAGGLHVVAAWWQSRHSTRVKPMDSPSGLPAVHRPRIAVPVRVAFQEALLIALGTAVVLAPWTIRNHMVTGHVIPTTLWVGPSLYDGLNPEATGDSDMQFFEDDDLLLSMSEYEMDHEYRRRAWRFAVDHPGRTVELCFLKLARFWKPWPNAPQFQSWWSTVPLAAYYLPVMAFAAVGAWRNRRDPGRLLLTLGPVLLFSLIHCLFVGSVRYRLPAEYPLLILSAAGLTGTWPRSASAPSATS